jgi:hypothetical protein
MAGQSEAEATPFFEPLCLAMTNEFGEWVPALLAPG